MHISKSKKSQAKNIAEKLAIALEDNEKLVFKNKEKDRMIYRNLEFVRKYHSQVLEFSKCRVVKKTLIYTCNALLNRDAGVRDEVIARDLIEPIENSVSAYGARLIFNDRADDLGELRPEVTRFINDVPQRDDPPIQVTHLRFPVEDETYSLGPNEPQLEPLKHNLMFFFHPPLIPKDSVKYELRYSFKFYGLFTDVLEKQEDVFFFSSKNNHTDLLQLIFEVPKDMNLSFEDMPERWRRTVTTKRRLSISNWIKAEQMTKHELDRYDCSPDFRLEGWKASNLEIGCAMGIMAHG